MVNSSSMASLVSKMAKKEMKEAVIKNFKSYFNKKLKIVKDKKIREKLWSFRNKLLEQLKKGKYLDLNWKSIINDRIDALIKVDKNKKNETKRKKAYGSKKNRDFILKTWNSIFKNYKLEAIDGKGVYGYYLKYNKKEVEEEKKKKIETKPTKTKMPSFKTIKKEVEKEEKKKNKKQKIEVYEYSSLEDAKEIPLSMKSEYKKLYQKYFNELKQQKLQEKKKKSKNFLQKILDFILAPIRWLNKILRKIWPFAMLYNFFAKNKLRFGWFWGIPFFGGFFGSSKPARLTKDEIEEIKLEAKAKAERVFINKYKKPVMKKMGKYYLKIQYKAGTWIIERGPLNILSPKIRDKLEEIKQAPPKNTSGGKFV